MHGSMRIELFFAIVEEINSKKRRLGVNNYAHQSKLDDTLNLYENLKEIQH